MSKKTKKSAKTVTKKAAKKIAPKARARRPQKATADHANEVAIVVWVKPKMKTELKSRAKKAKLSVGAHIRTQLFGKSAAKLSAGKKAA
jgi:hypothetical protein